MKIIKTRDYQESLKNILRTFMYRISIYFDDEYIRDMTHKGYTIPYEVDIEKQTISIIGITKYKNSLR